MNDQEATKLFDQLVEHIKTAPWFTEEWSVYREGNYIHIRKNNWFDDHHNGVHFETYLGKTELEEDRFPILLHAESDVPNRDQFVNRMIIAIKFEVPSFMCGTTEETIFEEYLPLDKETFVSDVINTLNELQFMVPFIDMCLNEQEEKNDD